MKSTNLKSVAAGALAFIVAVPMFAQSRGDQRRDQNRNQDNHSSQSRSYRENQRITAQGKVSSFTRERDGYRVHLDRGRESYWVPQSYFRNRGRDLRVGISVVFGGIFRGGDVYVDDVNYNDGYNQGQGYVRGVIQEVDYRGGTAWVRDEATGRPITVDLKRNNDRRLRRGDYVELSGQWGRDGIFDAYRIERVR
jgi:hypothetical protein